MTQPEPTWTKAKRYVSVNKYRDDKACFTCVLGLATGSLSWGINEAAPEEGLLSLSLSLSLSLHERLFSVRKPSLGENDPPTHSIHFFLTLTLLSLWRERVFPDWTGSREEWCYGSGVEWTGVEWTTHLHFNFILTPDIINWLFRPAQQGRGLSVVINHQDIRDKNIKTRKTSSRVNTQHAPRVPATSSIRQETIKEILVGWKAELTGRMEWKDIRTKHARSGQVKGGRRQSRNKSMAQSHPLSLPI